MKVIKIARNLNLNISGIIINKYRNGRHSLTRDDVETTCEIPVLGVIPEDKNVKRSIYLKKPVVISKPNSPASISYKKIAAKLFGIDYKENRIKGFFGRFI